MKFNIIAYSKDEYISGHTAYNKTTIKNMEYAKIPERVIYGSIRGSVRKMRIYNAKPIFLTNPSFLTTLRKF